VNEVRFFPARKEKIVVRKDLTIDQLGDLVRQPLCATLATYRSDGTVLLSPVWHEWVDAGFNVVTLANDIKAKHLRRDPRVGLAVADNSPPYRGLEVSGRAALRGDDHGRMLSRIAVRYLGAERGAAYAKAVAAEAAVVIRIEPGRLRAWDFADEF
jgi:PPOX class probable F420-dependent enzyme